MTWTLYEGDCLAVLRELPGQSVHCCVTSPPYWNLRDYGVDGQFGLEATPDCGKRGEDASCGECYVCNMVQVFREVKRVLRDDGTVFLNLGDSYFNASGPSTGGCSPKSTLTGGGGQYRAGSKNEALFNQSALGSQHVKTYDTSEKQGKSQLKPKDLIGTPWRVAFALQADGWWLRSDIIWAKPNPMPESVTDRPTKAHEYIFLLSKSERYYYDAEAIKEPAVNEGKIVKCGPNSRADVDRVPRETLKQNLINKRQYTGFNERWGNNPCSGRNKRTVWTVATQPFPESHFATFPPKLIEPCILAGCPQGGIVLDPFAGAGTTLLVSENLGRSGIGIELNPEYCNIIRKRMANRQTTIFEGGGGGRNDRIQTKKGNQDGDAR